MAQNIIIARHGETEINAINHGSLPQHILNGDMKTSLTNKGILQSEECARQIEKLRSRIGYAVSSALPRASLTLRLILNHLALFLDVHEDSRLNERSLGDFQGSRVVDVYEQNPDYAPGGKHEKFKQDFVQHAPNGENYADVTRRAWAALQDAIIACNDKDILLVAHSHVNKCLIGKALGLSQERILGLTVPNCEPLILEREGDEYSLAQK